MTLEDLGEINFETFPAILERLGAKMTLMQQRGRFLWQVSIWGADWKKLKRPLTDLRCGQGAGASPNAAIRAALKSFLAYKPYVPKGITRGQGDDTLDLGDLTLDLGDLK